MSKVLLLPAGPNLYTGELNNGLFLPNPYRKSVRYANHLTMMVTLNHTSLNNRHIQPHYFNRKERINAGVLKRKSLCK
jgi:hypothetical protein